MNLYDIKYEMIKMYIEKTTIKKKKNYSIWINEKQVLLNNAI